MTFKYQENFGWEHVHRGVHLPGVKGRAHTFASLLALTSIDIVAFEFTNVSPLYKIKVGREANLTAASLRWCSLRQSCGSLKEVVLEWRP